MWRADKHHWWVAVGRTSKQVLLCTAASAFVHNTGALPCSLLLPISVPGKCQLIAQDNMCANAVGWPQTVRLEMFEYYRH
jgi:hypothetical protein